MPLSGQVYCISGSMPSGKSKAVKSQELIAAGAQMAKSLTNAVTHLLVDHLKSTTSKTIKARKNGIDIVDETMVDQMMLNIDESNSVMLNIDGKNVMVPQTQATATCITSRFTHNEYLVYQESQHRIRYVLEFEIQ